VRKIFVISKKSCNLAVVKKSIIGLMQTSIIVYMPKDCKTDFCTHRFQH